MYRPAVVMRKMFKAGAAPAVTLVTALPETRYNQQAERIKDDWELQNCRTAASLTGVLPRSMDTGFKLIPRRLVQGES